MSQSPLQRGPRASVTVLLGPGSSPGSCGHEQTPGAVARPLPTPSPLQFQGEWFVLGLAGNTHTVADRSLQALSPATFTLNKNNRLEVAYAMFR